MTSPQLRTELGDVFWLQFTATAMLIYVVDKKIAHKCFFLKQCNTYRNVGSGVWSTTI